MIEKLETKKFVISVEGHTEKWYLEHLLKLINQCDNRKFNLKIDATVEKSPKKFSKRVTYKTAPTIYHFCDLESNNTTDINNFHNILSEMVQVKKDKMVKYKLGYSNLTFELWMILHKAECNTPFSNKEKYLKPINNAFNEKFISLDEYKKEDNFKRCLSKISLLDVRNAIKRGISITNRNIANGNEKVKKGSYSYYVDNPALSIHEIVQMILDECGV